MSERARTVPHPNDLLAEIERLRTDADLALGEATRLLESFVNEHCSPVPKWKPLPDLIGVLSQLSNAVTTEQKLEEINRKLDALLSRAALEERK